MTFYVKPAFLHGDYKEDIFMYQPEGFHNNTSRVFKLTKSLYGLNQATKNWNKKITVLLKTMDFTDTEDDLCAYYNNNKSIIIALFVDDGRKLVMTYRNVKYLRKAK